MSKRKRRAKAAKPAAKAKLVKLKAPAGCGPLKRGGRRYAPTCEGIVVVPAGLVEDLLAHGFAPLSESEWREAASKAPRQTHEGDYGG